MFILNFIKFSDHQAANNANEFVVGVYKDELLRQELTKICSNSYHGKQVVVKSISELNAPVHLLFIPERQQAAYLSFVKKNGTLADTFVVADKNSENTFINFEVENSRLYFRLNEPLLASSNIKLASSIKAIAINNRN